MAKKKFDYFEAFIWISNYGVEYADALVEFFDGHFDKDKGTGSMTSKEVLDKFNALHEIEEKSDKVLQDITDHLVTEFIAPIEREDIIELAEELDDVVDELDEVLQRIYMNHLKVVVPEMIEMMDVVQRTTVALCSASEKFVNFKKKPIKGYIKEIHQLEDEGDKIYIRSMHDIYKRAEEGAFDHPLAAVGLYGVFSALEKCCDACECAGDTMRKVRLKNS